jgi:hypothetical protein
MQPSVPDHHAGEMPSSQDLPYGPLPVRSGEATGGVAGLQPLEQLVDLSWLAGDETPLADEADEQDPPAAEVVGAGEPSSGQLPDDLTDDDDEDPEPTVGLSVTSPKPDADDDVHFGVAARALGVSRKTVERMVKRGELERGPSNAPATVSKRALVATLEQRRRDVSHLTRATALEQARSGEEWPSGRPSGDQALALRELLIPVLAPLLDEFVAVRSKAAVLEGELERLKARGRQERARDQLLYELATKGWWGRRRTRQAVLRQYVLGDDQSDSGSDPG